MLDDGELDDLSATKASCGPEEWQWDDTLSAAQVARLEDLLDPLADRSAARPVADANLSFTIRLHEGPVVTLHVGKKSAAPGFDCHVSGPDLPRAAQVLLQDHLVHFQTSQDAASALPLFSLVEHFRLLITDDGEVRAALSTPRSTGQPLSTSRPKESTSRIKRLLFWSHHLLATSKRKDIVGWGAELDLWGLSKPGYPGVFVVEGSEADVDDFALRVKRLNWQALQVRCEELDEDASSGCRLASLDGDRKKPVVLEVETMADLAARMKAAGLHDMFLSAMKLER